MSGKSFGSKQQEPGPVDGARCNPTFIPEGRGDPSLVSPLMVPEHERSFFR